MAKNKATHSGHCQICDGVQKLPNGMLSKHGYTRKWGIFTGTCPGAEFEPFEISKDQIEGAIQRALFDKKRVQETIADILTWTSGAVAHCNVYIESRVALHKYEYGYQWIKAEVKKSDKMLFGGFSYYIVDKHDRKFGVHSNYKQETAQDVANEQNKQYIKSVLETQIKQLDSYVDWQRQRIKDWVPHPENLIPVGE